jgi:hypothetical protein
MSEKMHSHDQLAKSLGLTVTPSTSNTPPPGGAWPVVKGLWYNRQVIKLDGWHFENCRFDNCMLVAESQFFSVKECFIDKSNHIDIRPALIGVVQLANLASQLHGQFTAVPIWSNDGTVSFGVGVGNGY